MSDRNGGRKWFHTSATTWESGEVRGYTATISFNGSSTYTLTIDNGGGVSTYPTLRMAKNDFRKFLHDKSTDSEEPAPPSEDTNIDGGAFTDNTVDNTYDGGTFINNTFANTYDGGSF